MCVVCVLRHFREIRHNADVIGRPIEHAGHRHYVMFSSVFHHKGGATIQSPRYIVLKLTAKRRHHTEALKTVAASSGWFKNYISRRPYGGAALVVTVRTKKI